MVLSETGLGWQYNVLLGYVGFVVVLLGQIVPSVPDLAALRPYVHWLYVSLLGNILLDCVKLLPIVDGCAVD